MTAVSEKLLPILCEGQDDRAMISELVACGALPAWCRPCEPPRGATQGLTGVARALADRVDAGLRAVAMCDVDTSTHGDAAAALCALARDAKPSIAFAALAPERDGRVFRTTARGSNGDVDVAIVVVGTPGDAKLTDLGIETWSIDDYVLRLLLDADVYRAFANSEKYAEQDHAKVLRKTTELRALFRENGMPLLASKRYLHLLRAVVDFRASAAKFAEHLVSRAARADEKERLRVLLDPWLTDLGHAISLSPTR